MFARRKIVLVFFIAEAGGYGDSKFFATLEHEFSIWIETPQKGDSGIICGVICFSVQTRICIWVCLHPAVLPNPISCPDAASPTQWQWHDKPIPAYEVAFAGRWHDKRQIVLAARMNGADCKDSRWLPAHDNRCWSTVRCNVCQGWLATILEFPFVFS